MSRFFTARSSGSEDESSDDAQVIVQKPAATVASRAHFLFSDEEDEDTKRVVRSQKDKRFDEISSITKQLKNHKKIKDMSKILTEFENLGRAFTKAKNVVDKEGIPTMFIKCLVELEDFIKENWEDAEGRKKLSKLNAKALTALRQKVKKYNKTFENDIEKYRENPQDSEGEEEEEEKSEDSEDEADGIAVPSKPEPQAVKVDKDEDSDSDDYDSDYIAESSSGSDSELDIPQGGKVTASMFLKRDKNEDEEKIKEKKLNKKKQAKQKMKEDVEEEDEGAGWEEVKSSHSTVREKLFKLTLFILDISVLNCSS
ncbi:eukaryotic translation initiation factor 3 subunit C-like isoform X1 [Paramuricea clavata]|uniref:Eukaryotic translation initiation factor 3 subunit C-like isoform X1 n=1 Tax=Paramuricea clavata TaxID=317549 RepID=A0A7D9DMG4_PARCT|nr:eukaryotic translation initiation factor 3 subunit C-like isoform X1 [Paramuricea clavata]